jgi:protein RecA
MSKRAAKTHKPVEAEAMENLAGFSIGADVKVVDVIPTGHPELDQAISGRLCTDESGLKGGGFPLGKLVLLYGDEGGGKSSLAYRVVGAAQRKGYTCAWVDTEHSFSEQLAEVNGCDVGTLYYSNLEKIHLKSSKKEEESILSGELVMQNLIDAIKSNAINVIVLDSVAALVPEQVLKKDVNEDTMATLARIMAKALPKVAAYAQQNNVLVIFINQLREQIGDQYGPRHTYSGGRTLRHLCSTVVKVMKPRGMKSERNSIFITDENGEQKLVGRYSEATIEKNRFNVPHSSSISVPIYYEPYFPDVPSTVFELARSLKVVRVRLNVYTWEDIKAEGKSAFLSAVEATGKMGDLVDIVRAEANRENYPLPIEVINYNSEVGSSKPSED